LDAATKENFYISRKQNIAECFRVLDLVTEDAIYMVLDCLLYLNKVEL
jgi:hypothetical protein